MSRFDEDVRGVPKPSFLIEYMNVLTDFNTALTDFVMDQYDAHPEAWDPDTDWGSLKFVYEEDSPGEIKIKRFNAPFGTGAHSPSGMVQRAMQLAGGPDTLAEAYLDMVMTTLLMIGGDDATAHNVPLKYQLPDWAYAHMQASMMQRWKNTNRKELATLAETTVEALCKSVFRKRPMSFYSEGRYTNLHRRAPYPSAGYDNSGPRYGFWQDCITENGVESCPEEDDYMYRCSSTNGRVMDDVLNKLYLQTFERTLAASRASLPIIPRLNTVPEAGEDSIVLPARSTRIYRHTLDPSLFYNKQRASYTANTVSLSCTNGSSTEEVGDAEYGSGGFWSVDVPFIYAFRYYPDDLETSSTVAQAEASKLACDGTVHDIDVSVRVMERPSSLVCPTLDAPSAPSPTTGSSSQTRHADSLTCKIGRSRVRASNPPM